MRTGRPKKPIILSKAEEEQLKSISRSRSFSHGLVTRAKIIIMSAEGTSNKDIARKLDYSPQSVSLWRRRFLEKGISGLHDQLRPGRPRSISDEQVAELVRKTLQTKPSGRSYWSTRSIVVETFISRPTVRRIWNAFVLEPNRQRHFKISADPFFVEKDRDIFGL